MKKIIFILLMVTFGCSSIIKLYNNFTDYKLKKQTESKGDHIVRLYFDSGGDLYPDLAIDSSTFIKNDALLEQAFINANLLDKLYKSYNLPYEGTDDVTKKRLLYNKAQKHIQKEFADSISKLSVSKSLVFLIHGYNNTATEAEAPFVEAQRRIKAKYPKTEFQFVEVYWDGLHHDNMALNSLKIWDNAQVSSSWVGLGLRGVINKINHDNIHVLTHSHGAAVITEALFNVRRFKETYYDNDKFGKEFKVLQSEIRTPNNNFVVGMLAPAIPGMNVFYRYSFRTGAGGEFKSDKYNYEFINGYNRYDQVTSKPIIQSSRFGSTTLACEEDENNKVINFFKSNPDVFSVIDFSDGLTMHQTSHKFLDYISNPNFDRFLEKVFIVHTSN